MSGVSDRLHGYPKVWNMGHPAIADLFDGPVVVQEKVDGSQFTFGVIGGRLRLRSKGVEIHGVDGAGKLFEGAVLTATMLANAGKLTEGWQYRGEAMCAPRHNSLTYGRAPKGNVILFDVDVGPENRVAEPGMLAAVASELGLECVPTLYHGTVSSLDQLRGLLDHDSCLGAVKVEGVVVKNYARWGKDGKMLMGKLVSDAFREVHAGEWKKTNPDRTDILDRIREMYRSEQRWEKAIQHRRESGQLLDDPKDIGPLLKEIERDVREECEREIADALFAAFWGDIRRGLTFGFPEWYKRRLSEQQFARPTEAA